MNFPFFFRNQGNEKALQFDNDFCLSTLCYMISIFNHLNQLDLSLQEKAETSSRKNGMHEKEDNYKTRQRLQQQFFQFSSF